MINQWGTDGKASFAIPMERALPVDLLLANQVLMWDPVQQLMVYEDAVTAVTPGIIEIEAIITNTYYGAFPSDPATRPNGTPSQAGDRYYNTTVLAEYQFNGTVWTQSSVAEAVAAANAAAASAALAASKVAPSFRNRAINGQFRVNQAGFVPGTVLAAPDYVADQFQLTFSQASKLAAGTYSGAGDFPAGFAMSQKITTASAFAPGVGDLFTLQHPIEANDIIDFQLGLATAQTVTISFYVKGTLPGNYSLSLTNAGLSRSYVTTYPVTANWTRVSIVIPLDITGVWPVGGTGLGMWIRWDLGAGFNLTTASPNAWGNGNVFRATGSVGLVSNAAASLWITGVQIELGSVATPYEEQHIGTELLSCARFYEVVRPVACYGYFGAAGGIAMAPIKFQQLKRIVPTMTVTSTGTVGNLTSASVIVPTTAGALYRVVGTAIGEGGSYDATVVANARF